MVAGQIITFLVVVLCAPGECVEGHVPLADLTLAQCFANDPRIPRDAIERWQVHGKDRPEYVPVLAWCEREKRRPPYREICSDPAAAQSSSDVADQLRHAAHACVGRTVLDDIPPRLARDSSRIGQ